MKNSLKKIITGKTTEYKHTFTKKKKVTADFILISILLASLTSVSAAQKKLTQLIKKCIDNCFFFSFL